VIPLATRCLSPSPARPVDLEMLVLVNGRESTERECRVLLEQAGFEPLRVIPTGGPTSVIEASRR
jgi:hypothetical protein